MEHTTCPTVLGICSPHTTTMTQTTSPGHSSLTTQTKIPGNHPRNTNGYFDECSPPQSESAMTVQQGQHTIRMTSESLLERGGIVPTGKLSHITHITERVGGSAMFP